MKHWNRRMGVKILCFILSPILLVLTIAGAVGIYVMADVGVYTTSRQEMEQAWVEDLVWSEGRQMLDNHLDWQTGALVLPGNMDILGWESNLRYRLTNREGELLATNLLPGEDPQWLTTMHYDTRLEQNWVPSDSGNMVMSGLLHYVRCLGPDTDQGTWLLQCALDPALEVWDHYKLMDFALDHAYALRYWGIAIVAGCLLLAAILLINLFATASRRPGSDALHPGTLHKFPTDLVLALTLLGFSVGTEIIIYNSYHNLIETVMGIFWIAFCGYWGLGLLVGGFGRLKQGVLLKNTLVWKVCSFLWRILKKLWHIAMELLKSLPMVWRSGLVAALFGLWALLFWGFAWSSSGFSVLLLLTVPVMMAIMVLSAIALRKLQKAGENLAQGNLTHKVDTAGLYGDLKTHADNLNAISDGMARAVESRLQSERMKAELITNVSHDIKNPLTSIINYADLIAQEDCGNENHREYCQVLVRKSEHLKRLLEDLVEVSRASTGNLDVEPLPCDAATLLNQLSGEFQERCAAAGLTLLTRQPEEPVQILADSRRIWRVFENLMQNACKYSLPGSRVYLSLEKKVGFAQFAIRNTSREPLDISPEELMERFVRGDSSRTTEGNGLGLSIAQSLTQLQGGTMALTIDGDLFKVTVSLPLAE